MGEGFLGDFDLCGDLLRAGDLLGDLDRLGDLERLGDLDRLDGERRMGERVRRRRGGERRRNGERRRRGDINLPTLNIQERVEARQICQHESFSDLPPPPRLGDGFLIRLRSLAASTIPTLISFPSICP